MKSIPHRLTGQGGLTYVAHLACRDGTDHPGQDVAAAFLDEDGQWRGYRDATPHHGPERATLALMQTILGHVSERTDRSYIHFYPADADLARAYRAALTAPENEAPAFSGPEWDAVRDAYAQQRCGISVIGGKKPGTGGQAAHALLSENLPVQPSEPDRTQGGTNPVVPDSPDSDLASTDYDVPF